ncbi:MAG: D-alanine--D-alanine ligase [Peptoniphilaceae bacterium]|nr:D-alanine--D-alanine ligase [Peptoniphilaceae bacterium]MDY5765977.1 D-alanine--D-alanine ligase family protein [Peptoniphilaceae bacterium]
MKNIVVLCGGRSTEHEIALRSAKTVINELDHEKYYIHAVYIDKQGRFIPIGLMDHVEHPEDLIRTTAHDHLRSIGDFCSYISLLQGETLVFPVIHGQTGEDGEIQGFLQALHLPYVGNGVTASALCMDKGFANEVLRAAGIPEADFIVLTESEWLSGDRSYPSRIEKELGFPCFVKPANNGSSVGVSRAEKSTLEEALKEAFRYDRRVVIEKAIVGKELEVSVLGNAEARASLPGSYTTTRTLLDYDAKYMDKTLVENVPHPLSDAKNQEIQQLALKAYHALGCEGFARVDIFMDQDERFYVNEINTFPGMTPSSLAPKLWTSLTDMTFRDYLDAIIEYAQASQTNRAQIETSWGNE